MGLFADHKKIQKISWYLNLRQDSNLPDTSIQTAQFYFKEENIPIVQSYSYKFYFGFALLLVF